MPIELAAILLGTQAVSGIVDGSIKIVNSIRSGMLGGKNDAAKKQLEGDLDELRRNLSNIGVLAEAADAYLDALVQVRRIDVDALLLDQYLEHNRDALGNHMSSTHEVTWRTVDQLVDTIGRDKTVAVEVHLNRKSWFDVADDQMIGGRLNDVNVTYAALVERVKARHLSEVQAGLEALQKPVEELEVLLHGTLADQILKGLRDLRQAAPPPTRVPT
jgi:hypothetical protein